MEVVNCYSGSREALGRAFLSGSAGALGVVFLQRHLPVWLSVTAGAVAGAAAIGVVSGSCFFIRQSSDLIPKTRFDRYWVGLLMGNICLSAGLGLVEGFVKTVAAAAPALGGGILAGISPIVCSALISTSIASSILALGVGALFLIDPEGIKDRLVEVAAGSAGAITAIALLAMGK